MFTGKRLGANVFQQIQGMSDYFIVLIHLLRFLIKLYLTFTENLNVLIKSVQEQLRDGDRIKTIWLRTNLFEPVNILIDRK